MSERSGDVDRLDRLGRYTPPRARPRSCAMLGDAASNASTAGAAASEGEERAGTARTRAPPHELQRGNRTVAKPREAIGGQRHVGQPRRAIGPLSKEPLGEGGIAPPHPELPLVALAGRPPGVRWRGWGRAREPMEESGVVVPGEQERDERAPILRSDVRHVPAEQGPLERREVLGLPKPGDNLGRRGQPVPRQGTHRVVRQGERQRRQLVPELALPSGAEATAPAPCTLQPAIDLGRRSVECPTVLRGKIGGAAHGLTLPRPASPVDRRSTSPCRSR